MSAAKARLGDKIEPGKIELAAACGIVESAEGNGGLVLLPLRVLVE